MLAQQTQWQDQMLGRYRLREMVGQGGMGEVWLAEDTELQRQVAVKLLPPVLHSQQSYLQAFNREARLVASLEHPHILSVHDFGELAFGDDIVTYLIMPLITGGSLDDLLEKQTQIMPVATALRYLRQAAEAIDFAHSKRILHRDIKPANMLLQDDWLFLSDFGIATLLTTQTFRSQTKVGGGTPLYMSPEQCRGRALPASDCYSLAVVAYQLLTGSPPFEGGGPLAVMLKHIQEEPPSPREFNLRLSQELSEALLRGLAKDPEQRPPSCVAFVEELERIHGAETLVPRIQGDAASTLIRHTREHHMPHQTGSPDANLTNQKRSDFESRTTQVPETIAERARPPLSRRSFLLGGVATAALLAGGGYALANALYQPPKRLGPQRLILGIPRLKLTGHIDYVTNALWNPQGNLLASGGYDTRIMLWDLTNLLKSPSKKLQTLTRPAAQWKMGAEIYRGDLDWSPDGRSLVAIARDNIGVTFHKRTIATINVVAPHAEIDFNADPPGRYDKITWPSSPVWSPGGTLIAAATDLGAQADDGGGVLFWNAPGAGKEKGIVKFFNNPANAANTSTSYYVPMIRWSLDGTRVLGLDNRFHLLSWNGQTGKQQVFKLPDRSAVLDKLRQNDVPNWRSLETSPARPNQVIVDDVDLAVLYDLQRQKIASLLVVADPAKGPLSLNVLAWSPSGRYVAGSYLESNQIFIWDLDSPHPQKTSDDFLLPVLSFGKDNGHGAAIADLSWSPDGRFLASASEDHTVILWQVDAD